MTGQISLLLGLLLLAATAACAPRTSLPDVSLAPRADIEIRSSPNTSVLVYASKPAAFAVRGRQMELRADTIRAMTPVNVTAYLNTADIHIVANGDVPIQVAATLTNAPATRAAASGGEIVLYSGGTGIGPRR